MKHDALTELLAIIKLPDWSSFCPEKLREEQLDDWCKRWIVDIEFSQDVVNTKYLTSEYNDLIRTKLAQSLCEDAAEEAVTYKVLDKRITANMCALRRKSK